MSVSLPVFNLPVRRQLLAAAFPLLFVLSLLLAASPLSADEPYARSRDYDLQHSRIALKFDVQQKKVIGDVTHSISILRDRTTEIVFDSSGLTIQKVTVNRSRAKFETSEDKLIISLDSPAHAGDKFEVNISYEATPSKGLYFILPDRDFPARPIQIWTQGESQDTHFYLPTYDYPNERLTTETILTVPDSWITVANGKLISVSLPRDGMKTWTWRESIPSSTYLITVVAGQFDEVKDSWHGIPVDYFAPKGRADRLSANYSRTPQMIELFSSKLGVPYPWEKYDQSMVDDFVAGGMENSSATTNTSASLRSPELAPEYPTGEDDLISHELGHQWFGDLVTCKDWGDVWLNEGFATFMETVWTEAHFGKDQADYDRWEAARGWFAEHDLFEKPIVRFDFSDSSEFDGNAYTKGGWVLYMLRHQLGDDAFYTGLHHYLEVNRGKNAVTSDLVKAIEQATHTNVDQFFDQWVYGAGAPMLDLSYKYDGTKNEVVLTVKQTQKLEGSVGLFHFPVDVDITTASGARLFPITISKASEVFDFPVDSAPLMVLFDKGGQVLKSTDFHKDKAEWLYQLKHASELADRADAVAALAKLPSDAADVSALGDALRSDKAWGVRANAADALGQIVGVTAPKQLLEALDGEKDPWVRTHIVAALGNFKHDSAIEARLNSIAAGDKSYRARASALQAIGKLKSAGALTTLEAAVSSESPDDILRDAALRALGPLGDDKAVPLLLQWSAPQRAIDSRVAAIASLARLDKSNKEVTAQIASYLSDSHFSVSFASIFALGSRGDASAIPALEAQLHSKSLSILVAPMIERQIARLKNPGVPEHAHGDEGAAGEAHSNQAVLQRLDHLEHLVEQMNDRLKSIESRLPAPKP